MLVRILFHEMIATLIEWHQGRAMMHARKWL
jgi:hypothetical protein